MLREKCETIGSAEEVLRIPSMFKDKHEVLMSLPTEVSIMG